MTLRCNDRLCTRERGAGLGSTGRHEWERKRAKVKKKGKREREGEGETSETDGYRDGRGLVILDFTGIKGPITRDRHTRD